MLRWAEKKVSTADNGELHIPSIVLRPRHGLETNAGNGIKGHVGDWESRGHAKPRTRNGSPCRALPYPQASDVGLMGGPLQVPGRCGVRLMQAKQALLKRLMKNSAIGICRYRANEAALPPRRRAKFGRGAPPANWIVETVGCCLFDTQVFPVALSMVSAPVGAYRQIAITRPGTAAEYVLTSVYA